MNNNAQSTGLLIPRFFALRDYAVRKNSMPPTAKAVLRCSQYLCQLV
jgi:hypothetical protein